ncbi:MAG: hypothetical protein K2Q21_00730 [Chitinophagaceae bacterium]|nr:hypothetical protein [Chitinophagaceae bacterium]
MKWLFVCLLLIILAACNNQNEKSTPEPGAKQTPLAKSANSPVFNASFNLLLNAYFDLSNGFIAEKDSGIAQSARALILASDSLKLSELHADSSIINTAKTYSEGISAELKGLLGETEILAKKRSLQMVSDQLYDLIRTVQYDQKMLFHLYCSSAFDDQGAYWISDKSDMLNPYLPKKMPVCREIRDTIQFIH